MNLLSVNPTPGQYREHSSSSYSSDAVRPAIPSVQPSESESKPLPMRVCQEIEGLPCFESPAVYKERADANMKKFLARGRKQAAEQVPSVGAGECSLKWIDITERERLLATEEGKSLILFFQDVVRFYSHKENFDKFKRQIIKILAEQPTDLPLQPDAFIRITLALSDHLLPIARVYYKASAELMHAIDVQRLVLRLYTINDIPHRLIVDEVWHADIKCAGLQALLDLDDASLRQWMEMHNYFGEAIGVAFYEKYHLEGIIKDFFWTFFEEGKADPKSIITQASRVEEFLHYLQAKVVMPTIFRHPLTDIQDGTSRRVDQALSCRGRETPIDIGKVTFGEEFEFFDGSGQLLDAQIVIDRAINQWPKQIKEVCKHNGIANDDYKIEPYEINTFLGYLRKGIKLRVGEWNAFIYRDYDDLLEVNTSPYHIEQTFLISSKDYSVYRLFDLFILDIARDLNLVACSGHKHLDVSRVMQGNAAILFRLLIDVNNKAWLPRLIKRENKADKHYRYPNQKDTTLVETTKNLVRYFNAQLKVDPQMKEGDYSNLFEFKEALVRLQIYKGRNHPVNIENLQALDKVSEPDFEVREPKSTIEFRFFHGARSGMEAKAINKMLLAWLQLMERHHLQRTPLKVECGNPHGYPDDAQVINLYKDFLKDLKLDWEEMKLLSHLDLSHLDQPPPLTRMWHDASAKTALRTVLK